MKVSRGNRLKPKQSNISLINYILFQTPTNHLLFIRTLPGSQNMRNLYLRSVNHYRGSSKWYGFVCTLQRNQGRPNLIKFLRQNCLFLIQLKISTYSFLCSFCHSLSQGVLHVLSYNNEINTKMKKVVQKGLCAIFQFFFNVLLYIQGCFFWPVDKGCSI